MRHGITGYVQHKCRCDVCRTAKIESEKRGGTPRACRACGKDFVPFNNNLRRGNGLYCSRSCAANWRYAEGRAPVARKTVRAPGHPLANNTGRVLLYRHVLYERIGEGPHPCYWCEREVEWVVRKGAGSFKGDLVVDHLDGDMHNNAPENLVPACNDCNTIRALALAWERRTGQPLATLLKDV